MTRLPLVAFLALVVATIAAFFITQHLKVTTPLISGVTQPDPAVINPLNARDCYDPVRHQRVGPATVVSFYVLHASDKVNVYVVDERGGHAATLASNRFMKAVLFPHEVRTPFTWDGHEGNGQIAPDGTYYFRVHLVHQGRTVTLANFSGPLPVTVDTQARCQ